jgi:hypothetical protein
MRRRTSVCVTRHGHSPTPRLALNDYPLLFAVVSSVADDWLWMLSLTGLLTKPDISMQ